MVDMPGDEEEFNNIVREKAVIGSLVENRWTVELMENLFNLFEGSEWIDEGILDKRQRVSEIHDTTQQVLDRLEQPDGYDVQRILSMDEREQSKLKENLDSNTQEALRYSRELLQRVEGQHDVVDRLPGIIETEVNAAFEQYLGGNFDVDLDYGDFAQHFEQNLSYEKLGDEIDIEELSGLLAADLDVDESKIASEVEVDEETIAEYLDEQKIGEYVTVETRFNGTVNVDQSTLEAAFEDADLETVDYERIEQIVDRGLEVDVVDIEDQTDYRRIENILERKIPDDYATQEGLADEHHRTREVFVDEFEDIRNLIQETGDTDEPDSPGSESEYELGIMEKAALIPIKIGDALNYGGDDR